MAGTTLGQDSPPPSTPAMPRNIPTHAQKKHYLELAIVGEYDEIILEGAGAAVLPREVHQLIVLIQGHQALPLVRRYLYTHHIYF
jgi:hypothetical protein